MYKNDSGSVATILILLLFSLTFSCAAITYFAPQINPTCSVGLFDLPTSLNSYSSTQNFQNGQYNISTLARTGSNNWVYVPNVGFQLIMSTVQPINYFYIQNIQPDSSRTIINTYVINNTPKTSYSIVLVGNAGTSSNEIIVENDGFHIPAYLYSGTYFGEKDFIPYAGAAQIQTANIQTTFQDCSAFDSSCVPKLTFTFNGDSFSSTKLNSDSTISILGVPLTGGTYYGGIAGVSGILSNGLVFQYFSSGNTINTNSGGNILSSLASFISSMLLIAGWTVPDCMLPVLANLVLIKTQVTGIIVCVAVLLRGATG